MSQAVEQGARRPEHANQQQRREDMPMRREQRLLDGQPRYLAGTQAVAAAPAPLREQLARPIDFAQAQRQMDVGEKMAELAKAHGQVQHADAEQESQQRLEGQQQGADERQQGRRQRHAQPPGDGAMALPPSLNLSSRKRAIRASGVDARAGQRLDLLEDSATTMETGLMRSEELIADGQSDRS